jgi:putative hydrolase of the HAD superfamily
VRRAVVTSCNLRAVLCDLDGVLRHWPGTSDIERRYGLAPGSLLATAFRPDLLEPAITGAVTDEQWRARIAAELAQSGSPGGDADTALAGRTAPAPAAAAAAVQEWSRGVGEVDVAVLAWLDAVRRTAPVVLVTNATTRLQHDLSALGLIDHVDAVVNSSRIGVAKPDPRLLVHAAGVVGAPIEQCLFVDDSAANVDAARRLGMVGVVFTGIETLPDAGHSLPAAADAPGRGQAG